MKIIAPSILSCDFSNLGTEIARTHQTKAEYIHIDVNFLLKAVGVLAVELLAQRLAFVQRDFLVAEIQHQGFRCSPDD